MMHFALLLVSGRSAAWLAHLLWEQRVGGSNPSAPTKKTFAQAEVFLRLEGRGGVEKSPAAVGRCDAVAPSGIDERSEMAQQSLRVVVK